MSSSEEVYRLLEQRDGSKLKGKGGLPGAVKGGKGGDSGKGKPAPKASAPFDGGKPAANGVGKAGWEVC